MPETTTPHPSTTVMVPVPLWALERFVAGIAADDRWNHADDPELGEAFNVLAGVKDEALGHQPAAPAQPPLPPGEFLSVQVKGYQTYEGWVTEGTFCGSPYVFVRDQAGRLIAKFPPDSVHCMTPLLDLSPVRPLAALPAGDADPWAGEDDGGPRACDCGPGERCFECATDDEAAAAIPLRVDDSVPF